MAKQLDPAIGEVLKKYGIGKEACWDCHGTWVVYHKYLEIIKVKAKINFEKPMIVEADGGKKIAALCVFGSLGGVEEWSIGEAAPGNNKNAYPWAMAEKRAKDRVILKLIGLHGIAYSEEEADELKYAGADLTHKSDQQMADGIAKVMDKPALIPVPDMEDAKAMWKKWSTGLIHHISRSKAPDEVDQWIAKNGVPLGNLGQFSEKAYDHVQAKAEAKKAGLLGDAGLDGANTMLGAG